MLFFSLLGGEKQITQGPAVESFDLTDGKQVTILPTLLCRAMTGAMCTLGVCAHLSWNYASKQTCTGVALRRSCDCCFCTCM